MVTKVSHETMIVCIAECRRMTVPKMACTGALLPRRCAAYHGRTVKLVRPHHGRTVKRLRAPTTGAL